MSRFQSMAVVLVAVVVQASASGTRRTCDDIWFDGTQCEVGRGVRGDMLGSQELTTVGQYDKMCCSDCSADHCKYCLTADEQCEQCMPGYILTNDGNCEQQQTECSDHNCQKCTNTKCYKCRPSYFLKDGKAGTCEACDASCATCDSYAVAEHKCRECKKGYHQTSQKFSIHTAGFLFECRQARQGRRFCYRTRENLTPETTWETNCQTLCEGDGAQVCIEKKPAHGCVRVAASRTPELDIEDALKHALRTKLCNGGRRLESEPTSTSTGGGMTVVV